MAILNVCIQAKKNTSICTHQDLHEGGEDVEDDGARLPRPERARVLEAALLEGLQDVLPLWLWW